MTATSTAVRTTHARSVIGMDPAQSLARSLRSHPAALEVLVPVVLASVFVVVPLVAPADLPVRDGQPPDLQLTGADAALTALSALALLVRRRHPLPVLLSTAGLAAAGILAGLQVNLAQLAVAVALFNYGVRRPRTRTLLAAGATAFGLGVLSVIVVLLGQAQWGRQNVVLWLATSAAMAVAVASRRATIDALEDRARRAEESREETARRRVAEDRVRIARELHDVIAHHVAVISVQAGVAEHVVEKDPATSRAALRQVRSSAKAVLTELQSVLSVLRQDENALPTTPVPGLARVQELVDSFSSTGAPVELDLPSPVPALPPVVDLAAFRLVQEALTNVQKHAPGAATTVTVHRSRDGVDLVVSNGRPPARRDGPVGSSGSGSGSGLGLVGMRERVSAVGGSLETGPTPDGGFRVAARMPLPREDR